MEYAIWIVLMVALIVVEACTANLVCIWFAIGALGAAISKLLGANMLWQTVTFVLLSAVALGSTKPLVKKLRGKGKTATNADMVIGKTGIVIEEITNDKFAGKVKVAGQEWSAVTADGSEISKNSKITVMKIDGVKLVVEQVKFASVTEA